MKAFYVSPQIASIEVIAEDGISAASARVTLEENKISESWEDDEDFKTIDW